MRSYFVTEEEHGTISTIVDAAQNVAHEGVSEAKARGNKMELYESQKKLLQVNRIKEALSRARFDKEDAPFRGYQLVLENDSDGVLFDQFMDRMSIELPDIERRKHPKMGKKRRSSY